MIPTQFPPFSFVVTKRAGGWSPPARLTAWSFELLSVDPDSVEEGGTVLEQPDVLDVGIGNVALLCAGVHERRLLVCPHLLERPVCSLSSRSVEGGAARVQSGV